MGRARGRGRGRACRVGRSSRGCSGLQRAAVGCRAGAEQRRRTSSSLISIVALAAAGISMRVLKKEGVLRGGEKNVGRFVITRCLCNANLGTRRESRHAGRISGTWGESRTFPMFQRPPNSICVYVSAHLGTSRHARHISRHISESSTDRESGTRLTGRRGALPRMSLTLTRHSFTRNGPCEGD